MAMVPARIGPEPVGQLGAEDAHHDARRSPYTRNSGADVVDPDLGRVERQEDAEPGDADQRGGEDDAGPDGLGRDQPSRVRACAVGVCVSRVRERDRGGGEREPAGDVPDEVVVRAVRAAARRARGRTRARPTTPPTSSSPLRPRRASGARSVAIVVAPTKKHASPRPMRTRVPIIHSSDSTSPAHSAVIPTMNAPPIMSTRRPKRSPMRPASGRSRMAPTASAPTARPTATSLPPSACRRSAGSPAAPHPSREVAERPRS